MRRVAIRDDVSRSHPNTSVAGMLSRNNFDRLRLRLRVKVPGGSGSGSGSGQNVPAPAAPAPAPAPISRNFTESIKRIYI